MKYVNKLLYGAMFSSCFALSTGCSSVASFVGATSSVDDSEITADTEFSVAVLTKQISSKLSGFGGPPIQEGAFLEHPSHKMMYQLVSTDNSLIINMKPKVSEKVYYRSGEYLTDWNGVYSETMKGIAQVFTELDELITSKGHRSKVQIHIAFEGASDYGKIRRGIRYNGEMGNLIQLTSRQTRLNGVPYHCKVEVGELVKSNSKLSCLRAFGTAARFASLLPKSSGGFAASYNLITYLSPDEVGSEYRYARITIELKDKDSL